MQLELEDYKKDLEFIAEYELSLKPLIIDILVVKKKKDIVIKKNFAKIFRKVNIIEYKSPKDYLSVQDFYKVLSYANLYIVKNNLDFEDITITFIENRHPQKFLKHLRDKHKYVVDNEQNGIYKILGGMFPIQIIEISKLSVKDNFWLSNLRDDIDKANISSLIDTIAPRSKEEIVKMYADVVLIKANPKSFEEIIDMKSKLTIEEVLKRTDK
ncbi:hypothetical protein AGMMS49938_19070 [Fibrobacterales bacterium]|nr:hypothetical protein AGMMS49938_19070 [Fibrobacterales bacterium]